MQLPDMNLLVALDALLDEGSVVGAARRMNLSPAAMSRTLTRIREAIGDPILVRAGRGLVPTPKALALREQVRDVVEQAALLFSAQAQRKGVKLYYALDPALDSVFLADVQRIRQVLELTAEGDYAPRPEQRETVPRTPVWMEDTPDPAAELVFEPDTLQVLRQHCFWEEGEQPFGKITRVARVHEDGFWNCLSIRCGHANLVFGNSH